MPSAPTARQNSGSSPRPAYLSGITNIRPRRLLHFPEPGLKPVTRIDDEQGCPQRTLAERVVTSPPGGRPPAEVRRPHRHPDITSHRRAWTGQSPACFAYLRLSL